MDIIRKIKYSIKCIFQKNYYSFRRVIIWPEGEYKRGMLMRIQKIYKYKYFVETGTYLGETPIKLSQYFEHIWTIELDETLFRNANEIFVRYPNISCINGDSKDILPIIINKLDNPSIFWLDGHYSEGQTASGAIKAPILQEIEAISTSKIKSHIIVIDDVSDFSVIENNAPLSKIISILENINS